MINKYKEVHKNVAVVHRFDGRLWLGIQKWQRNSVWHQKKIRLLLSSCGIYDLQHLHLKCWKVIRGN